MRKTFFLTGSARGLGRSIATAGPSAGGDGASAAAWVTGQDCADSTPAARIRKPDGCPIGTSALPQAGECTQFVIK